MDYLNDALLEFERAHDIMHAFSEGTIKLADYEEYADDAIDYIDNGTNLINDAYAQIEESTETVKDQESTIEELRAEIITLETRSA